MNRLAYLLCLLSIPVLFSSCEKDNDENNVPNTTSQRGYGLSHSASSYVELAGATEATDVSWTCSNGEGINLGFEFPFFDTSFHRILVYGGRVDFPLFNYWIAPLTGHCLRGFGDDMSFKVDGAAGNKILKVQWKDAEIVDGGSGASYSGEYVNMQLWLYEADGKIEMRYGDINLISGGTDWSPTIAVMGSDTAQFYIKGAAANPCFEYNPAGGYGTLDDIPASGTIYTLIPGGTGGECS